MITRQEILMGRDKEFPLTQELEDNLAILLEKVNIIRSIWGKPLIVTSGYRPAQYNQNANGAKKSAHMSCQAADFKDIDREFSKWCLNNLPLLKQNGLYLESPKYTPSWTHLQIRPTKFNPFIP